jgi:hypothetical protein
MTSSSTIERICLTEVILPKVPVDNVAVESVRVFWVCDREFSESSEDQEVGFGCMYDEFVFVVGGFFDRNHKGAELRSELEFLVARGCCETNDERQTLGVSAVFPAVDRFLFAVIHAWRCLIRELSKGDGSVGHWEVRKRDSGKGKKRCAMGACENEGKEKRVIMRHPRLRDCLASVRHSGA